MSLKEHLPPPAGEVARSAEGGERRSASARENESLIADMADSLSHLLLTTGVAVREDLMRLGFTAHAIDAFHAVAMERAKADPRVVEALAQSLVTGDA